jgi:iron complex transport system substrate-binding protein
MSIRATNYPRRIVCLTEETTETLYLLGEQDRIAGVSGYTARPPEARRKPKVSAFISAKFDKILALEPDLVLGFSNLQADIARELISRGVNVMVFNQRSVDEILDMILMLGRMVGAGERADALVTQLGNGLNAIAAESAGQPRPRVFFEEWHDPLISGIRWVEELVEIAGGEPVFPELRREHDARNRIVTPQAVAERDPEIVIASWCGRKVNKDWIGARPGWDRVAAIRDGQIHEVKSTIILQPGPAALTDGVRRLREIIAGASNRPTKSI